MPVFLSARRLSIIYMTNNIKRVREEEKEKLVADELSFLQNQMSDEERRREVIEGKTGQLLGQVSIVVSVVALFIPLISDQVNGLPVWLRVISIVLFFALVIAFTVSIWIASASWIIRRYGYLRPSLEDLREAPKPQTHLALMQRQVALIDDAIKQHIEVNNVKGTKLIWAGQAFRIGILLLGILVICLSLALSVQKNETKKVEISSPVHIVCADSALGKRQHNNVNPQVTVKHSDSTINKNAHP